MDYATYHLLGEPETTIDKKLLKLSFFLKKTAGANSFCHSLQS